MRSRLAVAMLALAPAVGVALAAPVPARKVAPEEDLKQLQGCWFYKDPGLLLAMDFEDCQAIWTCQMQVRGGCESEQYKFTVRLDARESPRHVDLVITGGDGEGPTPGQELAGIYKLDGDTLWIRWSRAGRPRPEDLEDVEGGPNQVLKLFRP